MTRISFRAGLFIGPFIGIGKLIVINRLTRPAATGILPDVAAGYLTAHQRQRKVNADNERLNFRRIQSPFQATLTPAHAIVSTGDMRYFPHAVGAAIRQRNSSTDCVMPAPQVTTCSGIRRVSIHGLT